MAEAKFWKCYVCNAIRHMSVDVKMDISEFWETRLEVQIWKSSGVKSFLWHSSGWNYSENSSGRGKMATVWALTITVLRTWEGKKELAKET
jgi:hypothetical protein